MPLENSISAFIGCEAGYDESKIVIFGAPYDCTTSYRPGTRFGPRDIRAESFGIETYSPYQDKDLTDCKIFDSGDLELRFGSPESALDDIKARTAEILSDGKLPLMLGGEHLVTLGQFRAIAEKYNNDVYILHFDAHADLRDEYLGQHLSHACVLRRCHDIVGDGRIFQFGIRSGDREEFRFAEKHTVMFKTGIDGVSFDALPGVIEKLKGKNVYLTIDLDVLDPAFFCGTGTPEAGGATFNQLLDAIIKIGNSLNIVGADLNELSPHYDQSGASTAIACKLLRETLLAVYR
ncbi:MAG: agmatinase [Oscillospiraceae bacterium]|nr:agmatinase [Oscillospiraceae bacterium]